MSGVRSDVIIIPGHEDQPPSLEEWKKLNERLGNAEIALSLSAKALEEWKVWHFSKKSRHSTQYTEATRSAIRAHAVIAGYCEEYSEVTPDATISK